MERQQVLRVGFLMREGVGWDGKGRGGEGSGREGKGKGVCTNQGHRAREGERVRGGDEGVTLVSNQGF